MDNVYFAADSADITSSVLLDKAKNWNDNITANGYLDKLKRMYRAYHGSYYTVDGSDGHEISFSGEQGELAQLPVNHFRNIAEHIIVMTTSNRPVMQTRAVNTDYKSLRQTILANNILDYYMREKRLEEYFHKAVTYSIVLGAGFIKIDWNSTSGEIYDYIEETKTEIREGDIEFSNLSPFDVVFDSTKENQDHDWVLVRTWKNKYSLAAKYPELKEKILSLKTKSDLEKYRFSFNINSGTEFTDDVPVYEFYHKKDDSLPDGRYIRFLDSDIILHDIPMPYRVLPIFRISPGDILGTPYGYSPLFDLLPLQEAINCLYSIILSNQNAFGVQNIWVPPGSNLNISSVEGGLNVIESQQRPEPINLTNTPKEIFEFVQLLEAKMETLSGVNSVSRGNADNLGSNPSGAAMALIQSMAIQFMSGLQNSYVKMVENVGTALIKVLQDYASTPRLIAIAGKKNRTYMKEFTSEDISSISRVVVDMGNPLAKCLAKDTLVLMYDGSKKLVQDIKPDDLIMGPDSGPRTIESISSGKEMMYEITSLDVNRNIKYGCNESHILTLKYCSDDYRYDVIKGDILDISIKDYLKLPNRQKRLLQGFTVGVEYEKKNIPIPPYILGAWLGDGHSAVPALTSMDKELVDEWTKYANSLGLQIRVQENRQPNKSKVYFITSSESHGKSDRNQFMNILRELELINNKHIPNIYLTSDRKDRLDLLAGLLDTDGYRLDQTFVFTQKSENLSKNVIELAKSLGFRVTYKKVKTRPSKLIENVNSEIFKITIGGDTHEIPTKLPRKQAKFKEKSRDPLNYGISVECKGEGIYYGFTLKEEPHFLLGDFTVTHNTTAGRVQMADQLLQYQLLKDSRQYIEIINTGNLDVLTEDIENEFLLIRAENEKMVDGEDVITTDIDAHQEHISEHKCILNDPDLRKDPELVSRVLTHIQSHIDALRNVDPDLLMLMGQQPLQPQNAPAPTAPTATEASQSDMNQLMEPPNQGIEGISNEGNQIKGPGIEGGVGIPKPSNPPGEFSQLPTTTLAG